MNKILTEKLFNEFSNLFRGRLEPDSLMSNGFSCGDGWYSLIHNLSASIVEHSKGVGLNPKAKQVKEKFAGLRFYLEGGDETTELLYLDAEKQSFTICEDCGAPGNRLVFTDWTQTLCFDCKNQRTTNLER